MPTARLATRCSGREHGLTAYASVSRGAAHTLARCARGSMLIGPGSQAHRIEDHRQNHGQCADQARSVASGGDGAVADRGERLPRALEARPPRRVRRERAVAGGIRGRVSSACVLSVLSVLSAEGVHMSARCRLDLPGVASLLRHLEATWLLTYPPRATRCRRGWQ